YHGTHLHFDGAYCDPKPLQQLPEIWVGGGGEQVTLRIAARHADKTNWQVGLGEFEHKSEVLRTHAPDCRLFDTEADLAAWLDSPTGGSLWGRGDPQEYAREHFVGTVEQV